MPEHRQVPVADLNLDARNPRLEEGLTTQLDALHSMLRHLGKKILGLAEDLVSYGINPTDGSSLRRSPKTRPVLLFLKAIGV